MIGDYMDLTFQNLKEQMEYTPIRELFPDMSDMELYLRELERLAERQISGFENKTYRSIEEYNRNRAIRNDLVYILNTSSVEIIPYFPSKTNITQTSAQRKKAYDEKLKEIDPIMFNM
ncbi:MAG: hypothetical protein ACLFUO_05940 [Candidatus Woesearchaeota archaeon]